MRVAAFDFGSNTFLCLVGELTADGKFKVLADLARVVRLGEGLDGQRGFTSESLVRAESCLLEFQRELSRWQPTKTIGVATAAARKARNREQLILLAQSYGVPLTIISGDEEATLTYEGLSSANYDFQNKIVLDIGGGSTEVIFGSGTEIKKKVSLPMGVLTLKEIFVHRFPIDHETQVGLATEIEKLFLELATWNSTPEMGVVGVAGTPTTVAAMALGGIFEPAKVDGYQLSLHELQRWASLLCQLMPEEIEQRYPAAKARGDLVAVGTMMMVGFLKAIHKEALTVSVRGLRYGLAWRALSTPTVEEA